MARSQAIIVGGGIAASPAFTSTDETQGSGVIVTSDDPAAVGAASFGMDPSTRNVWIQGGLTQAQITTNGRKAVLLGLALVNESSVAGNSGVIIGNAAGINTTGGTVMTDGIAIGNGAVTDGNAVVIGPGVTVNCNAGTDRPIIINCTGVTGTAVSSLVAIGESTGIACNTGVFINGRATTSAGGGSTSILGTIESSASIAIGGGTSRPNTNGQNCIAIGNGRAGGPLFGTEYSQCIAIGAANSGTTNATGSGATGIRNSIAIGAAASATCASATTASVAIGPDATATDGLCVLGATTFPLELRIIAAAGGERLRVDATAVAGNTALMLFDVDNATLERVTVGAADSGGVGFKLLRIPN